MKPQHTPPLRRRTFMMATAAGMGTAAAGGASAADGTTPAADPHEGTQPTRVTVNGQALQLNLQPRTSLLDMLREQLSLTGAKKGCDHGQCGACTVHVDGRRVASCLTLAVKTDGCAVTTIEGIASPDGTLHPMQQAFIDHDALQCGYCTPGQVMAAIACVREGHATSDAQIRESMSGNICRCGAYVAILQAVRAAAPQMQRPEGRRHA
jgi:xanthine dehydrogenase YagT iron-sulfur-binding subunit